MQLKSSKRHTPTLLDSWERLPHQFNPTPVMIEPKLRWIFEEGIATIPLYVTTDPAHLPKHNLTAQQYHVVIPDHFRLTLMLFWSSIHEKCQWYHLRSLPLTQYPPIKPTTNKTERTPNPQRINPSSFPSTISARPWSTKPWICQKYQTPAFLNTPHKSNQTHNK